ncbi:MAG: hypothetical protein AAF984_01095 [Verrucomicrobiota bacterium]
MSWGYAKWTWENTIGNEQAEFRHGSSTKLTYDFRDAMGQGLMLAALSGFRGVAANFAWHDVTKAWENQQWSRVKKNIELAVLAQPRVDFFWDFGAWHLAWNASSSALRNGDNPSEFGRNKESKMWIEEGRKLLERGISINPESSELYARMADLHARRLHDFYTAAEFYKKASDLPDSKHFLIRFPGYMYFEAGDTQAEYAYWMEVWPKLSPAEKQSPQWERVKRRIFTLRKELSIEE